MNKNIYAFTDCNQPSFPGYISVNECYDKIVRITVRTAGHNGALVGVCALDDDALEALAKNIQAFLEEKRK